MFLALDPGFTNLGVAYWDDDQLIYSGVWHFRARKDAEPFSLYRNRGTIDFFERFQALEFDTVVIETMPLQHLSIQRALALSAITGIRIAAFMKKAMWHELSATAIKKEITGNGKATKAQMRRKILEMYPTVQGDRLLGEVPFDEIDAIAIGTTWKRLNENK